MAHEIGPHLACKSFESNELGAFYARLLAAANTMRPVAFAAIRARFGWNQSSRQIFKRKYSGCLQTGASRRTRRRLDIPSESLHSLARGATLWSADEDVLHEHAHGAISHRRDWSIRRRP